MLKDLIAAIADGRIEVLDLTAPLSGDTPIIKLPPPFANTRNFELTEISNYDDRPGTGTTSPPASTWVPTSMLRSTGLPDGRGSTSPRFRRGS